MRAAIIDLFETIDIDNGHTTGYTATVNTADFDVELLKKNLARQKSRQEIRPAKRESMQ